MQRLVSSLKFPDPWDRNALVENVAEMRGRAITLIPTGDVALLAGGPCGLWLKREDDDVVLYEDGTSDYHIDQIVAHELGHMLLEHDVSRRSQLDAGMLKSLFSYLDPAAIVAALGRSAYTDQDEHDAELFASLVILEATTRKRRRSPFRQGLLEGR